MASGTAHALRRVDAHLARVHGCERDWEGHPLPMSTPPGERYPLAYPRDVAVICRAWDRLADLGAAPPEDAAAALRGAAAFLLHVQGDDGAWGQRYDAEGRDRSLYAQEDNVAHAVGALARHVRHERRRGRASPFEGRALDAMGRGIDAARARLRGERGLYWSTTSVHESAIETGWTLWTNGAFLGALRCAADAARAAGRDDLGDAWAGEADALSDAIRRHLVRDGAYVRRLDPEGQPDPRPDITLLAPSYFGFADLDGKAEARAVERMEEALWSEPLGLLERYPVDWDDPGTHLHGGVGPYLSFSSWLAQRHAARGDRRRAREVAERILRFATKDGDLPEHVATLDAFHDFIRREWRTGRDLAKEMDPDVLRGGADVGEMLQEAARMSQAYAHALRTAREEGDGVVRLAFPHAWTHADVALALAMIEGGAQDA